MRGAESNLRPYRDRPLLSTNCIRERRPKKYSRPTHLLARKPFKVVAVALANKMAQIAWPLLAKGGAYRPSALATP